MFFQFGSKKMSKFMTANQLFVKKTQKTCFYNIFHVFQHILHVKNTKKHVNLLKRIFLTLKQHF